MKKLLLTCLAVACLATSCQTVFTGAAPNPSNVSQIAPPKYNIDDKPVKRPKVQIAIATAPRQAIYFRAYAATRATPNFNEGPVDGIFWCPTFEQLTKMDKFVRPKQHTKYTSESWDCDDMAKEWESLTHLWASHEFLPGAPVSLATFLCYVEIRAGAFDGRWMSEGKHALGLLCDNTGCWWAVDAQSGMHQKVEEAFFEGTITVRWIVW
jgi:hypothetical protein